MSPVKDFKNDWNVKKIKAMVKTCICIMKPPHHTYKMNVGGEVYC